MVLLDGDKGAVAAVTVVFDKEGDLEKGPSSGVALLDGDEGECLSSRSATGEGGASTGERMYSGKDGTGGMATDSGIVGNCLGAGLGDAGVFQRILAAGVSSAISSLAFRGTEEAECTLRVGHTYPGSSVERRKTRSAVVHGG